MGVASLVLGIISVVIAVFGSGIGFVGTIIGVIGIILGAVAKNKATSDPNYNAGPATAGLVLSIIGAALGIILFIACAACVGGLAALSY